LSRLIEYGDVKSRFRRPKISGSCVSKIVNEEWPAIDSGVRLSEHPRFHAISDWPQQLEMVLMAPMASYRAESIVRVLEGDSGSYALLETRLFEEVNLEHYHEDEVDRLDRAAEALFSQTQDSRDACPDTSSLARTV
jgi:hypothetical protein